VRLYAPESARTRSRSDDRSGTGAALRRTDLLTSCHYSWCLSWDLHQVSGQFSAKRRRISRFISRNRSAPPRAFPKSSVTAKCWSRHR